MGLVAPAHNAAGAAHLQPGPRGAGRARPPPSAPRVLGPRPADRNRAACGTPRWDPAPGRPLFAAAGRSRAEPAAPRLGRPPSWAPLGAPSARPPRQRWACAPLRLGPPGRPRSSRIPQRPRSSPATRSSPVPRRRRSPSVPPVLPTLAPQHPPNHPVHRPPARPSPARFARTCLPLAQRLLQPVGPHILRVLRPAAVLPRRCHRSRARRRRGGRPGRAGGGGREGPRGSAFVRVCPRLSVGPLSRVGGTRWAALAPRPQRLPAPPPPAPHSAAARGAASASAREPGGRGH